MANRHEIMRAVPRKDTSPELRVRKLVHRLGYRFRLHRSDLPGTPDLVLPKHDLCVFVHGCFWHRHPGCKKATTPKSNQDYWLPKFERNVQRDAEKRAALEELGWRVEEVWECETKTTGALLRRLQEIFPEP